MALPGLGESAAGAWSTCALGKAEAGSNKRGEGDRVLGIGGCSTPDQGRGRKRVNVYLRARETIVVCYSMVDVLST